MLNRKRLVSGAEAVKLASYGIATLFAQFASIAIAEETNCDFRAFVSEQDPKGLNVRAAPSEKSKVLGKIPPSFVQKKKDAPPELVGRATVDVLASRDGWFLINKAEDYAPAYAPGKTKNVFNRPIYRGKGWVSGKKLQVESEEEKAFLAPDENSELAFSGTLEPRRLLSCKGQWAFVEYSLERPSGVSEAQFEEILRSEIRPSNKAKEGAAKNSIHGWVRRTCPLEGDHCFSNYWDYDHRRK